MRLDVRVHELGLAESREQAKRLILAGEVRVAGEPGFTASDRTIGFKH